LPDGSFDELLISNDETQYTEKEKDLVLEALNAAHHNSITRFIHLGSFVGMKERSEYNI
jgi:hypothetical protein